MYLPFIYYLYIPDYLISWLVRQWVSNKTG